MKKFKALVAIAILIALFSNDVLSQAAGNYLYTNGHGVNADRVSIPLNTPAANNITLKAEVMMNVTPSSFTAIFAISQAGTNVFEVDSLMNQRIDQVMFAMGKMGIARTDIHIDAVAMVPTYAYKLEEKKFSKRSTEVPVGFEMKKNIHILFKHHSLLDEIISEMAFAEVYDLVKVDYNIDGIQTYYEELRQAALSVIQTKQATYDALKLHLDIYSMADGFNTVYPMERYKSYTAFNSGSSYQAVAYAQGSRTNNNITMLGHNNTVNLDGRDKYDSMNQQFLVQTAEKNKTIFYDRIPYNQFDKVINADTEEPSIQISYSLQVFLTMITDEQYKKNQEQLELQKQQQLLQVNNHKGKKQRRHSRK